MEIKSLKWRVFDLFEIHGRVDGLTSPELKRTFDNEATAGRRKLIIDLSHVTYISSAGLRVILQTHKSLKQIGGELILVSAPHAVMEVFRVSGMTGFFTILPDLKSLHALENDIADVAETKEITIEGIVFEELKKSNVPGLLFSIGDNDKMKTASYSKSDVVTIKPAEIKYGAGLAALGDDFGEYQTLFGESIVIGRHFFSYPAVLKPVIDYSYFQPESVHSLNFLNGFGFSGEFSRILRFAPDQAPKSVENLLKAAGNIAESNLFGVVILGVSGGIEGMHLKKAPVVANRLTRGTIFDAGNFSHWMNFSLEPEDINKTIVACGIFLKNTETATENEKKFFPVSGNAHLHAIALENGLWSNHILEFEKELLRVAKEFNAEKVLHLLPASRLKNGFIGIINLEVA
ncbi:MAG: STAS domain-containing protein [Bacteroidetes bacterium]|nr:STAS domain-containing protein [Bacteroidota bacterium]